MDVIEKFNQFFKDLEDNKIDTENIEKLNKILNEFNNIGNTLNKYVKVEFGKLKEIIYELSKILHVQRITTRGPVYYLPFIPEIGTLVRDLEIFVKEGEVYIKTKKVRDKFEEGLEYGWFHFYEPRNMFEIYYQKYGQERGYSDLIVFYTYFLSPKYAYTIKEINELVKSIINIEIFKKKLIPKWIKIAEKVADEIKIKFLTDELIEIIVENSLKGDL